jgi:glutamine synthetase
LDGYKEEPNLRSKVKIADLPETIELKDIPEWSFDGSSTKQAEGDSSDCILKPIKMYRNINTPLSLQTIFVLCEVYDKDNKPHETNYRALLGEEDENIWVGFEQEYFIRDNSGNILGMNIPNIVEPQGKYYCGVGAQVKGRELSNDHLIFCLGYGLEIEGTNAEVAIGQWEYQLFAKGKKKAADDLWMSRYFLYKLAELRGYGIEFNPKPYRGEQWNGSGLHTNFSNARMRNEGGEDYFNSIFKVLESRANKHLEVYGFDNEHRLTGKNETQSMDKFSWGISDRGASIRVPLSVSKDWKGYLEDRRPGSNADPYKVMSVICESLKAVETLDETLKVMYHEPKMKNLKMKNLVDDEKLFQEYRKED